MGEKGQWLAKTEVMNDGRILITLWPLKKGDGIPEVEKSCKGCVHEPSITSDEEGTVWGSDRDCETCIRMIGIPKDNFKPCGEKK